jgi:tetratricopeptide (TPR) repeat protein/Tol biopolymer transport system component
VPKKEGEKVSTLNRSAVTLLILGAIVAAVSMLGERAAAQPKSGRGASAARLTSITIDYPLDGSIFPPEITPPTFIWRDAAQNATRWRIDVVFADGSARMHVPSAGERLAIGEIDQRCVSATNELPKLTPEQAVAHTWIPEAGAWEAIKKHSVAGAAMLTISGFSQQDAKHAVSSGRVNIFTSKDSVGAPIFYRDVPLMPSETEKGIIKPLAPSAVRLIQWRLRDIGKPESRVVLKDMVVCANCHSFSRDGKTMGMDMDGPANDKGLYAIVPVQPQMTIATSDMVAWNPSPDRPVALNRVGFMSQVSPDGKYVVTTVNTAERATQDNYYVVNFKDYRFLQVFYPTRGILAWYSRATGRREPLPGADDPRYVQTDGVWSPDGSYLVFARAEAREPYPPDGKMATYANDPIEVQIQYDLYRVPFNGGRGGQAEAIAGGSHNGMSNTFPKVSPDGRWIVFVKCRNGQLMRPDSQLYIVPARGGQARRMRCNTPLMNSWHSFSPNGRWLVFSSKSRSPYTQMYLTHLDEEGNDSPAILIDNSTAANRAVNLPEFVNIPPDGLVAINTPAVDMYKKFDHAAELGEKGEYEAAIVEWRELLATNPDDARIHNNLGTALTRTGRYAEAIPEFEKALELNPQYHTIYNNLGRTLLAAGRPDEAIFTLEKGLQYYPESADLHYRLGLALASKSRIEEAKAEFDKALEINPNFAEAHHNLGRALAFTGQLEQAIPHFEKAIAINPSFAEAHTDLGCALAEAGQFAQAIPLLEKALALKPGLVEAHYCLGESLYFSKGRVQEALAHWREALRLDPNYAPAMNEAAHALAASPEASVRNGVEAVELAERAVQVSGGQDPDYLDTLAAAYAEAGRFPEAIAAARKALDLATQQHRGQLIEALNTRIKLYEALRPYRDTLEDAP